MRIDRLKRSPFKKKKKMKKEKKCGREGEINVFLESCRELQKLVFYKHKKNYLRVVGGKDDEIRNTYLKKEAVKG